MTKNNTVTERFWEKVDRRTPLECWPWQAGRDKDGYGKFRYDGATRRAHRFSYLIHHGNIPDHLLVMHSCDNHCCVNPAHLFLGTNTDNVKDAIQKGRKINRPPEPIQGEAHYASRLTKQQVIEIRQRYIPGKITQQELANEYGITQGHIVSVIKGKKWRHVK